MKDRLWHRIASAPHLHGVGHPSPDGMALLPALRAIGALDDLMAYSPAVAALIEGPDSDVHQIVCAVLVRDGRALLVHRSPGRQWYPNVWDLPGGHIEPGEDSRAALIRELLEELGVHAEVEGPPTARTVADEFVMDVWAVRVWAGEPVNVDPTEHDAIAWLTPDELNGLALAHPDVPKQVLRALNA